MFNLLQDGRPNDLLVRRFGMRQDAPAPQMGGELTPIVSPLEGPPDWNYLRGELLCWGYGSAAAVAAKNGWCAVWNPTGSGLLVTVEEVRTKQAASNGWRIGKLARATAPGAVGTWETRDTRANFIPPVPVRQGDDAVTELGTATVSGAIISCLANQEVISSTPVILSPGWMLACITVTVNLAFTVDFVYRYRAALASELST